MHQSSLIVVGVALALGTRASSAQSTYRRADIDAAGQLRIVLTNAHVIRPPKDSDQVAFEQVAMSADHRLVGWVALYPNCCTTYPIPLKLVLLRSGGGRTVISNELPIWQWAFAADGKSVVIRQAPVHGVAPTFYEQRDTRTGRVLATAETDSTTPATALPAWARGAMPSQPSESANAVMIQFERFADIFGSRLVTAFDSIPAARYDYRPTPAQQTVGYIAQHLENANYSLCERFGDTKHLRTAKDALADTLKARWPKDTLVARLEASVRFCDTALERLGPLNSAELASNLLAFETDLAEHYSQISSYMRLLGLVPPSALPPKQRTAIELPASALSQLVGAYELAQGLELVVGMRDGALTVRSTVGGDAVRLWPESASDFFVREVDAQITFTRDSRGIVTELVLHQFGRHRQASKVR